METALRASISAIARRQELSLGVSLECIIYFDNAPGRNGGSNRAAAVR